MLVGSGVDNGVDDGVDDGSGVLVGSGVEVDVGVGVEKLDVVLLEDDVLLEELVELIHVFGPVFGTPHGPAAISTTFSEVELRIAFPRAS